MTKQVYWVGPLAGGCQLTGQPFDGVMYDASTPLGWANICQQAFDQYGCRLGQGFGQKYEQQNDGRWLKVAG